MRMRKFTFAPGRNAYSRLAANDDLFGSDVQVGHEGQQPMQARLPEGTLASSAEVFSRAEDVWLRLARHPSVHTAVAVDAARGEAMVMFRIEKQGADDPLQYLLDAAASSSSHRWIDGDSSGRLVRDLAWCGNTLVIELVSSRAMQRWAEGESLQWQLHALLSRLRILGRCA